MLMKMIRNPKLKVIMTLCFIILCALDASASNSESMASPYDVNKGETPFALFCKIWKDMGNDDKKLTLLTQIPKDTLIQKVAPLLKKGLGVKNDVDFELPCYTVGKVLTKLLKKKYGGKQNEENDYRAIQYSTSIEDLDAYVAKYPNSPFCEEIKSRRDCFNENNLWEAAFEKKTSDAYKAFANACSQQLCQYEGCDAISAVNHKRAEAVKDWYDIVGESDENDPSIYKKYEDYIEKYKDCPIFVEEARAKMMPYKDRNDWNIAKSQNTMESLQNYLDNHKDGKFVKRAEMMLAELDLWAKAEKSKSYKDYCDYYTAYPDGQYAENAIEKIKQFEDRAWKTTLASNNLDEYENFLKKFPSGFYANEALKIIVEKKMQPYLKRKAAFEEFPQAGDYSHRGYSLICFGNADNMKRVLSFSMTGPTGYSKQINPGKYEWVRVKNGTYEVLIQGSKEENWRGTVIVENGIYYQVTWTGNNRNNEASNKIAEAIGEKVKEEKMLIESAKE